MQGLYQGLFRLRFSVAVFAAAAILAGLSVVSDGADTMAGRSPA